MKAFLTAAGFLLLSGVMPAMANSGGFCRPGETDTALKSLPHNLVPAARKSFGYTGMTAAQVMKMTAFRCAAGQPLMCSWGANLPCGKADKAPTLPAASQWCASNPNSDFIPAYVTGHDSAYEWHCAGGKAVATSPAPLDAQGYFKSYWKVAQ
jgi:hypothetical protein